MKLNHDCIRDVMLYLEENLTIFNSLNVSNIALNKKYTREDIQYTVLKLYEANYLDIKVVKSLNEYPDIDIATITWEGHKFLDTIRDNKVWAETKSLLSKFSSTSISCISTIASQVIYSIISKQLNL